MFLTSNILQAIPGTIDTSFGDDEALLVPGGSTTASTATIAQANSVADPYLSPVMLTTNDLDLLSGAQTKWMSSMVAARLQSRQESYCWGIGAALDVANSLQAMSTWSVWANFEILLP